MAERRDTRVMASVGVLVTMNGQTEACLTTDMSRGGMFLLMRKKVDVGTIADLTVVHLDQKLRARAKVVNVKPNGLGVSFLQSDEGFGDAIRAIMNELVAGASTPHAGAVEDKPKRAARASWTSPTQQTGWKLWGKGPRVCEVSNLTLDGAAIGDGQQPAVGETITFHLDDGFGDSHEVTSQAKVVRHTDKGFAVQFVSPAVEFRQAVSRVRRHKFAAK